ncbi:ABC transporter ATP-binding protein [Wolbachia endosymbiont (group A) of Myopa testacea]|uniref:ABC transporter ATP-binding protein n=1 Tax=Wolbachia endosymbiont (group A) of Myopa testacea TaxID=3066148 RepID=UPI00333E2365
MVALDGYIAKYFIDSISIGNLSKNNIIYFVLLFVVWWETLNIFWRISEYLFMKILPTVKTEIVSSVTCHIINYSHCFFQENFAGSISNKVSEISRAVASIIEICIERIFYKSMMLIFATIVLYSVNPVFALVFVLWCIIFILTNMYLMKHMENYANISAESSSAAFGRLVDIISNISNVKIFARKLFEVNLLKRFLTKVRLHDINLYRFEIKVNYIKGILNNILIGVMVYYLCALYIDGKVTLGDFSLIFIVCLGINNETWDLIKEMSRLAEEAGVCNQSLALINTYVDIEDSSSQRKLIVTNGEIEFNSVSFKHFRGDILFNDLSLSIEGGSKVGLVGYTGSGKSTFVGLIIRLFDINSGSILIDNQNIGLVTQDSLREHISFVPQDLSLFHRTLMENIRYGKIEAADEEVIDAAKLANAHEFIMKTEKGYESLVGERGIKLSGGQRQRIAIARAILKNAPILILDEATSALDSHTETLIQKSLRILMKGKTTIVIAHRLSTLLNMDRIIVFDKGKIVEDGPHSKLLELNGLYSELWNSQVSGFIVDRLVDLEGCCGASEEF